MHEPDVKILLTLSVSLTAALALGYITQRLKLSPILGYLLAGVFVGPYTPGFVAEPHTASLFAEIGVILLMFGVGLHFHLDDLLAVKRVAVPGAIGQIAVAAALGLLATVATGGSWLAGLVIGVAVSVASTVVLIRVLTDNDVLQSEQGHIAVGWLIVEDLFTVFVLVTLPALAAVAKGDDYSVGGVLLSVSWAIIKMLVLGVLVLWGGRKLIPWLLEAVARTRTRELFTLAILGVALTVATGSAVVFGVSMALGAFLAGMVVGQSEVSHQAAADALPMRDAFAVLFFVSVGMLFSKDVIFAHPLLFLSLLAIVLLAKPLTALVLVWALGYSPRTALTVAVGLAQIGEFSFILAAQAEGLGLVSQDEQSLLVACSIASIVLNPLLFRSIAPLEAWMRRRRKLWAFVGGRSEKRVRTDLTQPAPLEEQSGQSRAILIGYGPVGRTAAKILEDFGLKTVVIDLNVDTIGMLKSQGKAAVYGDAAQRSVLQVAGIEKAKYLLITIPQIETRTAAMLAARELNPKLKVFVRARYLEERAWLEEMGADGICFEEGEAAVGLAAMLLPEVGADEERVRSELRRLRLRFSAPPTSEPAADAKATVELAEQRPGERPA
ncbi:MAG: cation:proton antiporter [Pirellulales bacterium]